MGVRDITFWKSQWRRLEASARVRSHTYVVVLVFLATISAFGYYANSVRTTVHKDTTTAFQQQLRIISAATSARLALYESFLRGGAGLSVVHKNMTEQDWQTYFQSYDFSKQYPEIDGIAFEQYVTADQLPTFLQNIHSQGQPNFAIKPAGDRSVYVPNTYLVRYTNPDQTTGFDGYTDPVRRVAMLAAASSGMPAMSGGVTVVGDTDGPAFIVYLPVYSSSGPLNTADERQAALFGFVSVAVGMNDFISGLIAQNPNPNFALALQDNQTPHTDSTVYQSQNFATLNSQSGRTTQTIPFTLYQHHWELIAIAGQNIVSSSEHDRPLTTIFWGLLVSIVLAGVVWLLISSREFLLNRQKQMEVQSAKDDLLSLASHQLRTPATVVKQYVGMLLQGYGGDLTIKQTGMLRHAYDSNERQLQIINQLLYVARLDAGRITLHKEPTNVHELLDQVYHEHVVESKQWHQKLKYKSPKQPLIVDIDPQYFHMAIDNLVSNAVKYTPEKGTIIMETKKVGGEILVSVRDTGIGIEEDRQQVIFDKFTRLENELAAEVSGSGIGLYLTDQIVNLHGGYIEVHSSLGHGSTFTVHLPINPDGENQRETS
jgi:signal transduction histidine kinase